MANQGLTTYTERLAQNPDFQEFITALEGDAVLKLELLVSLPANSDKVEPLRGEIKGLLQRLDAPHVYQRMLSKRRERITNG